MFKPVSFKKFSWPTPITVVDKHGFFGLRFLHYLPLVIDLCMNIIHFQLNGCGRKKQVVMATLGVLSTSLFSRMCQHHFSHAMSHVSLSIELMTNITFHTHFTYCRLYLTEISSMQSMLFRIIQAYKYLLFGSRLR